MSPNLFIFQKKLSADPVYDGLIMFLHPDHVSPATLDHHPGIPGGRAQLLLVLGHEHLQLGEEEPGAK